MSCQSPLGADHGKKNVFLHPASKPSLFQFARPPVLFPSRHWRPPAGLLAGVTIFHADCVASAFDEAARDKIWRELCNAQKLTWLKESCRGMVYKPFSNLRMRLPLDFRLRREPLE